MNIEWVDIDQLIPNSKNRNIHSDEQIDRLAKIIKYQGWRFPIVADKENVIWAGHGRLMAAKKIGETKVPVSYQDFTSEEQAYAFLISDNSIASWAELDLSGINGDIPDLGPDFDIDLLGIKNFILEPADLIPQCDEDEVPEHVEPKTKLGDIYRLGNHRLMCGDSTSIDAVEKLMNGQKAKMCFCDPPYGVNYQKKNKMLNSLQPSLGRLETAIHGDDLSIDDLKELVRGIFTNIYLSLDDKSSYYITAPQGGELGLMMMMMQESGIPCRHMIVWVKNNAAFSMNRLDYDYKHEPILYGWSKDKTHEFYGNGTHKNSVWEIDRENNKLHPTMKPIAIIENCLLNSTKINDPVIDLCGGSGSTLVACEKTNRKCFMMEIDPHYCDVIVARWEKYTGQKADMING